MSTTSPDVSRPFVTVPDCFKRKEFASRATSYHNLSRHDFTPAEKDFIAQECIPPGGCRYAIDQEHLHIDNFRDDELTTDSSNVTFSLLTRAIATRYGITRRNLTYWITTRKDNRLNRTFSGRPPIF